ncbi:MAG: hypothetical protein QOH05_1781, partial [Acetobacteraceae bacterium]|nr:hypothetical protein [Acetobacteraceae bacterium]
MHPEARGLTQTIYPAGVAPGAARRPADVLMNFIVSLLAPMFLFASDGDVAFARLAAIETVNAYRARNQADLVAIAQIIGFGLAALGSLSLSMADDISLAMTLRLRGNANALHRSAEQNRRALQDPAGDDPMPDYVEAAPDPETAALIAEATAQSEDELLMSVAAARLLATEAEARL